MISIIKKNILRTLFIIFRIFPIKNNKIVVCNYYGKGYGDNAKYIVNYLLENSKNKYEIIWLLNNINDELPSGVKGVKYKSIKSFYDLATAKIWIDNCRKHDYILKRKNQFYIQTWHSSIRLKKIEKDAIQYLPDDYIKNAISDSNRMDILTVGCEYSDKVYDRVFWYNGKRLNCGTPRFDVFFNNSEKKKIELKVRKFYKISKDKKIILYAPTFQKKLKEANLDYNNLIANLNENSKNNYEYIALVRLHPVSKNKVNESKFVIDATNYPDIQELIIACDYFITDYSGCCFDAMYANKKCMLYIPDYDNYISLERELEMDIMDLPFPKIYNEIDLIEKFKNFNEKEYTDNINRFLKKIGTYENGTACEQICALINDVVNGDDVNYEKI